jgi:hypothetical protein
LRNSSQHYLSIVFESITSVLKRQAILRYGSFNYFRVVLKPETEVFEGSWITGNGSNRLFNFSTS